MHRPQHQDRAQLAITGTALVSVSIAQLRRRTLLCLPALLLSVATDRIRSVSIDRERVHIMEESRDGYEIENG